MLKNTIFESFFFKKVLTGQAQQNRDDRVKNEEWVNVKIVQQQFSNMVTGKKSWKKKWPVSQGTVRQYIKISEET